MAALIALGALVAFALGYRFYARFLGERIFGDGEDLVTPAHELEDGRDFVPTPRHILFGHHFTSIAGAAPIIGPCVAAYWGWLPALLWVVLGSIFLGGVHDFGALVVSVREKGRSIADVADGVMSGRARLMFLCFVAVMVWLVLAVFAIVIAGLFVSQPSSVLPVNISLLVAPVVGWLIYKRGMPALSPSLVALVILYAFVWVGTLVPVELTGPTIDARAAKNAWIVFLFVYCAVASLLPVWLLLQPRDFINSHQLLVGLGVLFVGIAVAHPDIEAPLLRTPEDGAPPLFPLLFVTVACGAISGFHGMVSSGTTSKQLARLRDARPIGYGSMLGEGTLALASTLAAVAGIGLVGACVLPAQGEVGDLSWAVYYDDWAHASRNGAEAFVLGGGAFLESVGLPQDVSRTLIAVLIISFAATSLDTAARIQRHLVSEIGLAVGLKALANPYVATALAILPALALTFAEVTEPGTGVRKPVGMLLWPVFGASNQMLAALTLMVMSLYFWVRRRPVLPLLVPMVLVTAVTLLSLLGHVSTFAQQGNYPMAALSAVLTAMVLWMLVEGAMGLRRGRAGRPDASAGLGAASE